MFHISLQDKKELYHCVNCDTYFKQHNPIHSCDSIRMRKLIRKRVMRETIKYSAIGFLSSLVIFLIIMLTMSWTIIVSYADTIHYIKEEIRLIHKVTDVIVNTKIDKEY